MSEKTNPSPPKPFALPATQVSAMLPPQARQALIAAASIDPTKPRTESQERTNALDHAIRSIKQKHPHFFR